MTAAMPKMKRDGLRVGTFVKTPSPQVIEILGLAGLDFAVVDAEHAPFDVTALDMMMLASHASGLPLMTRIPHRCSELGFAAVDGVDGIFIGPADLALSMGYESTQEPRVIEAIEQAIRAGRAAGKTVGMFVSTTAERDKFAALGVEWFVIGSDQSLLRLAAAALVPRP